MGKDFKGSCMDYFQAMAPRTELIELIPQSVKKILDVGAGVGETGRVLQRMGFDNLVGIEINSGAAEKAKPFYNDLIIGDVENIKIPYPNGYFDCILYGDILEHTVDPWQVLKRHKKKLSSDGVIIASIPNIRYYGILFGLVFKDEWNYDDAGGILDSTHLRFFTLKTIKKMFEECGFKIIKVKRRIAGKRKFRKINWLLFGILTPFLVWQYFIIATPTKK